MIKEFFLPTGCKLCYWGRMSLFAAFGAGCGAVTTSYWAIVPFVLVAGLMATLKWMVTRFS